MWHLIHTAYRTGLGIALALMLIGLAQPGVAGQRAGLSRWLDTQALPELRKLFTRHPRFAGQRLQLTVPGGVQPLAYEPLFLTLKLKHDATLLGLRNTRDGLVLNPALDYQVQPGDELFVMTAGRLQADAVDWSAAADQAQQTGSDS